MHLSFSDKTLRMICENEEYAHETLGADIARKLITRLADLMAAKCVIDIPSGSPHEISLNGEPAYKVNIFPPHHLIFRSVHEHQPFDDEGHIDWHNVSRIQIINIQ